MPQKNKQTASRLKTKMGKVMREFKSGKLKSGKSRARVTSRKQAVAIGLSEARRAGARVAAPKRKGKR